MDSHLFVRFVERKEFIVLAQVDKWRPTRLNEHNGVTRTKIRGQTRTRIGFVHATKRYFNEAGGCGFVGQLRACADNKRCRNSYEEKSFDPTLRYPGKFCRHFFIFKREDTILNKLYRKGRESARFLSGARVSLSLSYLLSRYPRKEKSTNLYDLAHWSFEIESIFFKLSLTELYCKFYKIII